MLSAGLEYLKMCVKYYVCLLLSYYNVIFSLAKIKMHVPYQ